jgi:hypothetical protein
LYSAALRFARGDRTTIPGGQDAADLSPSMPLAA